MSADYNLPVFCSPTELNFVIDKREMQESKPIQMWDPKGGKTKTVNISKIRHFPFRFNPYNHLIRFKFFSKFLRFIIQIE